MDCLWFKGDRSLQLSLSLSLKISLSGPLQRNQDSLEETSPVFKERTRLSKRTWDERGESVTSGLDSGLPKKSGYPEKERKALI